MRFSASVLELPTFSKLDSVEKDIGSNVDRGAGRGRVVHTSQRDGPASIFSKERTPPVSPTKGKKWIKAALSAIALALLASSIYLFATFFNVLPFQGGSEYYVVLDCGSTGTRAYVYEWSIDQSKAGTNFPISLRSLPKSLPKVSSGRAYQRMETEPGLHMLVYNETGLKSAIKPLMKFAKKHIPKSAHKRTQVFLYATAGVRRLPGPDSQWLLDKAFAILHNSSFSCSREKVKTISGMEEAYYEWLALNHRMGLLGLRLPNMTYGSLDLGGSSLQVTFETEERLMDETSVSLRIGPLRHQLSAYSLAGYGLNDAFDRSVTYLIKRLGASTVQKDGKFQLKHPCLLNGYRENYICSYCAQLSQDGSPLIEGVTTRNGKQGIPIELIGSPQWKECVSLAKMVVNASEWSNTSVGVDCREKPCALADNLPYPRGQFYAMSGFYVVYKFFNISSEAPLDDILKRGHEFCKQPWKAAKKSVAPQPFVEQYCFRAPYMASLLRDGLHIKDDGVVIGSGSITWTLGVALLEAGQVLSSRLDLQGYRLLNQEMSSNVLFILFFMATIFLIFALLCFNAWFPRAFQKLHMLLFKPSGSTSSVLNMPSPFRLPQWGSLSSERVKTPLSPKVAGATEQQHPFCVSGSGMQFMKFWRQHPGFPHSYSVSNLAQMQVGSWHAQRGRRRSQSREDLGTVFPDLPLTM